MRKRHPPVAKEEANDTVRCLDVKLDLGIFPQSLDVFGRHVVDHVDLARQQGRESGRSRGDGPHDDPIPFRLATPIVGVCFQHDTVAAHELHEPVRTRADGDLARVIILGCRTRAVFPRQDHRLHQVGDQSGVWCRRDDLDRIVIDLLVGLAARQEHSRRRGRRSRDSTLGPLNRIHDVIGRERRAVVPLRPLAKVKLPSLVIDVFPRFSEAGDKFLLGILAHQRIEYLISHLIAVLEGVEIGIDGRRLQGHADGQRL